MNRRELLQLLSAAGVIRAHPVRMGEDDPKNTKICHRINGRQITDDDLLFLKQIGLRWARVEFGDQDTPLSYLRSIQERFARYGIKIFSGVHYAYRKPSVQLGHPGRDK